VPLKSTPMLKPTLAPLRIEHAAEMLKALAHPMRLSIVDLISEKKSCTVSQIQEALKLEQAVVSQQLSILKMKDVLVCEREGKNSVYSLKYPCLSRILDCLKSCNS
jgi:DNA-binding transcriptional ArsR family regulator